MEKRVTQRKSNFELLRIISMLMVVIYHFYVHGNFDYTSFSINALLIKILSLGGRIGYDCFVLITGYFLVNSKFKIEKLLKVILEVGFYSIIIYFIFIFTGQAQFSFSGFLHALLPITYMSYSFATEYVIILLLSKYLNKLIHSIDKKELLNLILILTVLWSIIPTILKGIMGYSSVGLFFLLYLIGAYIRLYSNSWMNDIRINIIGFILSFGALVSSVVVFNIVGIRIPSLIAKSTYFSGAEKTPVILSATFLFLLFKNLNIRYNRIINFLGASTFGVLLIHDNQYVRRFLWVDLFKNAQFADSSYLILYAIVVTLIVFFVCIGIDKFRMYFIEKPFFRTLDKISFRKNNNSNINAKFKKIFD